MKPIIAWLSAGALALALASCQNTPKAGDEIRIVVGPNGDMTIVDKSGKASKDAAALAAVALMAQELTKDSKENQAPAPAQPQMRSDDKVDPKLWTVDADGHATHILSGAICYREWAGLSRDAIRTYIPDGTNVGCNYTNGANRFLTFYVFEGDLNVELASAVAAIKDRYPLAKETAFGFGAGSKAFKAAAFTFKDARGGEVRTSVLITKAAGWLLKIRLTCPGEDGQRLEEQAGVALMGQVDRLAFGPPKTTPPSPSDRT